MSPGPRPAIGAEAVAAHGWLLAHRWLILRRLSQLGILLLFLAGPWFGVWIVKGNLNHSLTLGTLPLTDPLLLLQVVLSGHRPATLAWVGAALVVLLYVVVGGRSFCAWTCPVNLVTDLAEWLRRRLDLGGSAHLSRQTRHWMLGLVLALAAGTGTLAWEMVNPVSMAHRGLIFGMGFGWAVLVAVFLLDLFVVRRGWCGHLCPVGAFYSLLGRLSLLRVRLPRREACNNCLDCFAVCPEHQVIKLPLKGRHGVPAVITDSQCTNCGRCMDVCSQDVFAFGSRFAASAAPTLPAATPH